MSYAFRVFQLLALAALTLVLGEFAWTIHQIRPKLEVTLTNVDRTIIVAGAAATHLEKAAGTWEQASKDQASATSRTMLNAGAAAKQLSSFIFRTDTSVNSVLLPALSNSITEQNAALLSIQKDLQANLSQMAQATAEARKVLADADVQISDPSIKKSLANVETLTENLDATTQQTAESMKQVTAIATDGRQIADRVRETYLKPQKFAWALFKELLGMGGSAAQIFH